MQNTHHPQFCTRDVDRRYCGGGAWISQSDLKLKFYDFRIPPGSRERGLANVVSPFCSSFLNKGLQGEIIYPPPTPISGDKAFFRGGGWGCIF